MSKQSSRNKTINTSIEDGIKYFNKCIKVESNINNIDLILNTTIYGDLFTVVNYLPNECFDLIIADPPYNLNKTFAESKFLKKSEFEYEQYTENWLGIVAEKIKKTGSIYVCCDWKSSLIIGKVLKKFFIIRNRITWQREKGRGAKANWKNGLEDIWYATKSDIYTFNLEAVKIRKKVIAPYKVDGKPKDWNETKDGNYRDTCPSNFWDDITIPFWSMSENTAHPTQKSEKLIAKILLASSNPGDIIFDPFLGSGTTSVTAKKLNRQYIGVEKEKQYCIWTEERLEKADTDKTIQGYFDGIFWERNSLIKKT